MWANLIIVFLLPLLPASSFGIKVTYLHPDEPHVQDVQMLQTLYAYNSVHIFCKEATPLSVWNVFQSSRLLLQISDCGDYKQYKANSMNEVYLAYQQDTEDFEGKPLGLGTNKDRTILPSVHDEVYYGICTNSKFVLTLKEISCDPERVAQFIFGLVLWLSGPLLEDSLLMVYCSAAALGAHLAAVLVVFVAVLSSGEEPSFARFCSLKASFKQVYEERPTLVILMLLFGAWIFQALARKVRFLWRYRIMHTLHCYLLRAVAYLLIFTASDHRGFGRAFVSLLLSWTEIRMLFYLLKSLFDRRSNQRSLACGTRLRRLDTSRYFARYPGQTNPVGILRHDTHDPFGACQSSSYNIRRIRRKQKRLHRQGCEDQTCPSTNTAAAHDKIFHPSRRSTPK